MIHPSKNYDVHSWVSNSNTWSEYSGIKNYLVIECCSLKTPISCSVFGKPGSITHHEWMGGNSSPIQVTLVPLHLTVKIFRLLLKISVQRSSNEYCSFFGIPSKERDKSLEVFRKSYGTESSAGVCMCVELSCLTGWNAIATTVALRGSRGGPEISWLNLLRSYFTESFL